MAEFKRHEVAHLMRSTGIVPVFFHSDFETARNIMQACFEGGVKVIEFTNRGDFAHEVFTKLRKYVQKELSGLCLGVGSVMDAPTAAIYMQNGADFVVSPILDEDTGRICNRRKVLWIPGCGSVTEIFKAHELGADIVKIFPGSQVGGPGFVKAVRGPMPWTDIMPTGGVEPTEENLKAWFEAGVCSVGMGSKLITKELVKNEEFSKIKDKASEALSIVKKIR
ncbi:MAG: bifunctional 4-hydroxy-2-oxoglutarate aldolase/2-dehydro-3-deoxy-phosphogluconate aldolase [Bacteroidota bacterium]